VLGEAMMRNRARQHYSTSQPEGIGIPKGRPCAPTNDFNLLSGGIFAILTTDQPLIVTNVLYSFTLHAAFGRQR
jgi:hypothetical protein